MRCIRCQSDSAEGTRFCALCGFPIALDDFVTCAVCGGEVHADVKVCPGCHHSFATPVPLSSDAPAPKRRLLFPVAIAGLALAIFAYIHTTISSAPAVANTPLVAVEATTSLVAVEPKTPFVAAEPKISPAAVEASPQDFTATTLDLQSPSSAIKVASPAPGAAGSRAPDQIKEHVIYFDIGKLNATPKKAPAKASAVKVRKAKVPAIQKKTAVTTAPVVVEKTGAPAEPELIEAPQEEPAARLLVSAEDAQSRDEIQRFQRCRGQWVFSPDCPRP